MGRHGSGAEEEGGREDPGLHGGDRHQGDRERGQVHATRLGDDQNEDEASDQGGEEDDVWPGGGGEGEASEDRREGLPGGRAQEERLTRPRDAARGGSLDGGSWAPESLSR